MSVSLNHSAESHASSLIDAGKYDSTSAWSFSAEDGDKLLGAGGDDWAEYARWHLGEDKSENEKTKARYKYPYGKNGKVYRSGLIAAKSRAGQEGASEIESAAGRLLDKLDKKDGRAKGGEDAPAEFALAYPHLASRLFNTPLMLSAAKAGEIVTALGGRLLGGEIDGAFMARLGDPLGRRLEAEKISAIDRVGNVAIIPVEGSLVHKGKFLGAFSGSTSYEGVQTRIRQAMSDDAVKGVVFEIDSNGGEVAGAFDTAAMIRKLSAKKPTIAILADHALSAGYLLASGARQIVVPSSGYAGSIGIVTLHVDRSKMMERSGVKVTILAAGRYKGEGNPYEPLAPETAERIRAGIERTRNQFAEAVALGRGKRLTAEAALATEADDYQGEEAVEAGLADAVDHPNEAFDAFKAEIDRAARPFFAIGAPMTSAAVAAAAAAGNQSTDHPEPVVAKSVHDTAVAESHKRGVAEGAASGATAERARIKAIFEHAEAAERPTAARHLAFNSAMPVEEAASFLAATPKEAKSAGAGLLAEMAAMPHPNLGHAPAAASAADAESPEAKYQQGAEAAKRLFGKK